MSTSSCVSTGHLPPAERVRALVAGAHERFKSIGEGRNADYIPALAQVPGNLFGVCVVGTSGTAYTAGDTEYEFSIQSVSKPFVFALICQAIGEEEAREKLGVNSTGLPFNSVLAIERSDDGTTNPMVNAGAIAAASLAPGTTADAKWQFICDGLSRFAGRGLTLNSRRQSSRSLSLRRPKARAPSFATSTSNSRQAPGYWLFAAPSLSSNVSRAGAMRWSSISLASVTLPSGTNSPPPALAKRMSRRPFCCLIVSKRPSRSARLATSL